MKIKVSVTVDLKPEDWTLAYGVEGGTAIREDVRSYIVSSLQSHFSSEAEVPAEVWLS